MKRDPLRELARLLSTVCNPFFAAIALFFILSYTLAHGTPHFWILLAVSLGFSSVFPMLYVARCYATGAISDLDMSVRAERKKLFGVFIAMYTAGTVALIAVHAPALLTATMAGYAANTAIVGAITQYWKISTHAIGITAPSVALVVLFGIALLPIIVLVPMVGWARVYLRAHTLAQVVAGVGLALVSVLFFFRVFHIV